MGNCVLALDIGSNSVGSMWFDRDTGALVAGTSVFPAGVDESDDQRGAPKNADRRMKRRTRITLRRRAERKRELRLRLISAGLLPADEAGFKAVLEATDPWELRLHGLDGPLPPHHFGRVLLHLAQRRGALGLKAPEPGEEESEDGKVKHAIGEMRAKMLARRARTFGEYMMMIRAERVTPILTPDKRSPSKRSGPREFRQPIRNKAASYEHCADRAMIRDEFSKLWGAQKRFGGPTAALLTDDLRRGLDDESGDANWQHRGLLFGQRRQSWDLGTLGRCVLQPTERCVPHADMYASRYLLVETLNNLRVIERGREPRPLTREERTKLSAYLSGPLGEEKRRGRKGTGESEETRTKQHVSVTDLRVQMGWGRPSKSSPFRFNIESDEDRHVNTDWFSREVIHGAIGSEAWDDMPERVREGINRALLKFDPDRDGDDDRLRSGFTAWAGLSAVQADRLLQAWRRRPKVDAKRLNLSRRAVRNLLNIMDRPEPWSDPKRPGEPRWLTQIEARKLIAEDADFCDVTTEETLDEHTRRRYATGAKGLTARDRHYLHKHGGDLPPAPLISNPVVRKAIHEVRRHVVEYRRRFGRNPDEVYIELAREARMGAKEADRLLFRNRLRNRIRNDILREFSLEAVSSTQQRAAVDRVVLCVQQGGRCPLCGQAGLTPRNAADGGGCEVAHIIPRAVGGHNGLGNLVLAHTKCNREMGRRTPRQFWAGGAGFEAGIGWVEGIYTDVQRPKRSEIKGASADALWSCYFSKRDDDAKIEQFAKDVKDIQEMTLRQEAATTYATRQVMAYLADALFNGKGLPERGGDRLIFTTTGLWTSRFRREWGLFFDPHGTRAKGLSNDEEHARKEKNRADHRHHAVDAVVIGLCTRSVQIQWEEREKLADAKGINTADESAMEAFRRDHPIPPPAPFKSREELRDAVRLAVFGQATPDQPERPVCHRPVKRKLTGALHEETLFGPVLDSDGRLTGLYTARKGILTLDPNHLRMPRLETEKEAIARLTARRQREKSTDLKSARAWARAVAASSGFSPVLVDPPPGKSGIIRDVALRARLRGCIEHAGLDPDDFSAGDCKRLHDAGAFRHVSGVPIKSFVLLRTMNEPVVIPRRVFDQSAGRMVPDPDPASQRAYLGGNNSHVELRVDQRGEWEGQIVSTFDASKRKLARLRALREAGIPKPLEFRKLPASERQSLNPVLARIERDHPIVDRRDDPERGGRFVMSLCEGETLFMRHEETGELGYFVVAKLDPPNRVVLVPHWDARAAGERKDAEGKKVAGSAREEFAATPSDFKRLAPPGHEHAVKVSVTPLGSVTVLTRD